MIREPVEKLARSLHGYSTYLLSQSKKVAANHALLHPVRADDNSITFLDPVSSLRPTVCERYKPLNDALSQKHEYDPILLSEFCPDDAIKRRNYIDGMKQGIQHHCAKFTHAFGGGIPSLHFVWRLPTDSSKEELVQRNTTVMDKLKGDLPVYHTRAMRKAAVGSFGRICGVKPAFMRELYRKLTGDASSSHDAAEAVVDERVRLALDTEDPEIMICGTTIKADQRSFKFFGNSARSI